MTPLQPTRTIVLASEETLFREAIRSFLENEPDFTLVAEAEDGLEAASVCERTKPDVALLDVEMSGYGGLDATTLIKERVPSTRVLVMADDENLEVLLEAIRVGATGFLSKDSALEDLSLTIRAVSRGETSIPRRLVGPLLSLFMARMNEQGEAIRRLATLTHREQEILDLVALGRDNRAIARALVISPRTAKTHVQSVLTKLGVHSRLEAAAFARRNGIVAGNGRNGGRHIEAVSDGGGTGLSRRLPAPESSR
jgi:two-component system NarL family response regulator